MRKLFLVAALVLTTALAWGQQSFFEAPRLFTDANTRFPRLVSNGVFAVAAYQRIRDAGGGQGTIDVVLQTTTGGLEWSEPRVVSSGIRYEGAVVPPVFSLAINEQNDVILATVDYEGGTVPQPGADDSGTSIVHVSISTDDGVRFRRVHTVSGDISLVSPRVFASASGGWFLTMERFDTPSNRIVYTYSEDGSRWDDLLAIPADVLQTGTQSDVEHFPANGRDVFIFVGENIVPPAVEPGQPDVPDTPTLYAIYSDDSGTTWSATDPGTGESLPGLPGISLIGTQDVIALAEAGLVLPHTSMRVTSEPMASAGALTYQDLVMRRPSVAVEGARRLLTFELGLRLETDSVRQVAAAAIGRNGNIDGPIQILTASGLRRTDARVPYNQPSPALIGDRAFIIAYQDPNRGGRIVLYEQTRFGWIDISPSASLGVASFPTAAPIDGRVHFFWHRRTSNNSELPTRLAYLEPDQRALPPRVSGLNFEIGSRSASSTARLSWTPAPDAAGIVGYAYEWTRDPDGPVPVPDDPVTDTSASFRADEDGPWYLRIRAVDRAGNWSSPATARFFRDTTPPPRVSFVPPSLDEDGFLVSNTFTLRWRPPEEDVIGGYFTDLVYVADESAEVDPAELPVVDPPARALIEEPRVSRDNYDNGLWALSVTAVDSVGNVGEPAVLYVRMNKYIPVTEIYTVAAVPDPLGRYNLSILGRGFTANGLVNRVILDEDGQAPYDYVFDRSSPGYRIFSDRNMAGPLLDNLQTGRYFVGLVHTERGLEFSPSRLLIERNGTVKFGDYTVVRGTPFAVGAGAVGFLSSTTVIAWIVVALMVVVALFSGVRLVAIGRDGINLRLEAKALVAGKPGLIAAREERIAQMQRKGIGLRLKFTFFVVMLVMAVVGMVAVSLGSATLNSQQLVLLRGLKDRVDVLMENMASDAAIPLLQPEQNTLELDSLPISVRAMDEALYATITGPRSALQADELPEGDNYVWGTNDPRLLATRATDPTAREELLVSRAAQGIDREPVPSGEPLFLGRTRLDDPISNKINALGVLIDRLGAERLNTLVRERALTFSIWNSLRQQVATADPDSTEAEALQGEFQQAELTLNALTDQITNGLEDIVRDALTLLRYAELRAIEAAGQSGSNSEDAAPPGNFEVSASIRTAVAEATYEVPDQYEEIESDLVTARAVLEESPRFSDQLLSPVKSYPIFVASEFDRDLQDFLFYQPVVEPDDRFFPLAADDIERMDEGDLAALSYFRGSVRLGVATDLIVQQIDDARDDIIRITVLIALAAIGAGIAGAILLATIVVIPINKLVRGVEYIRRTQDKSTLKDHSIEVRSRDELFRLADSINTMTVALAAAAEAEKDLIVTSDLQKKFIPLNTDGGRKVAMAHKDLQMAEFHGYYEGADALSGDYFGIEWLDADEHAGGSVFAVVKCDVSGHGVEAAFIMSIVATVFSTRVREWRKSGRKPNIVALVNAVNNLLAELNFVGKFAAITVAIVDTRSGEIRLTHGGDRDQFIYRQSTSVLEHFELNKSPATGVFDSEMIELQAPVAEARGEDIRYREYGFALEAGDIMMFATDGIEESSRLIRLSNFDSSRGEFPPVEFVYRDFDELRARVRAEQGESAADRLRWVKGEDEKQKPEPDEISTVAEEFSAGRIAEIVRAAMTRGTYRLERFRSLDPDEELVFDYRNLEPTAENLVLAVMSAEKVYRLNRSPSGAETSQVRVDVELLRFLEKHFSGYHRYFAQPVEVDAERADYRASEPGSIRREYTYFRGLVEEDQLDDLTILAVRKK